MSKTEDVSIKIQTGVYRQFRNLNNKVWFALGEFVDNSIQSYLNNKAQLERLNEDYVLEISIDVDHDNDIIEIKDNAAGINESDYKRAFEPANIPVDNQGLHEFGMGMKTASIWLSDNWTVKSKALGENFEKVVEFDLETVIEEDKQVLGVTRNSCEISQHYTEIELRGLSNNAPSSAQYHKIRKHLASIYRNFLRSGEVQISFNGEELRYENPEILVAPYYKDKGGPEITWKKEIKFSYGKYSVEGFVGILKSMSTSEHNGFSLFRRGRVIVGSHDEKYRPKSVCGQPGSPRHKRIFGELELTGFGVSFNKGSFVEIDDLEALMEAIKLEISSKEFDLYNQAEKYIKPKSTKHNEDVAKKLIKNIKQNIKPQVEETSIEVPTPEELIVPPQELQQIETIDSFIDTHIVGGEKYHLILELIQEPRLRNIYTLETNVESDGSTQVNYKINLAHSFFESDRFRKDEDYRPIIEIIKTLIIAELVARKQGATQAGNVRLNFNNFLNNV